MFWFYKKHHFHGKWSNSHDRAGGGQNRDTIWKNPQYLIKQDQEGQIITYTFLTL
jgi:hypothetical protein